MRYFTLLVVSLLCSTAGVVPAQSMFQRGYYPTDDNYYVMFPANSLVEDLNGDFVFVNEIGVIIRTNSSGEPVWQKQVVNPAMLVQRIRLGAILPAPAGRQYVLGTLSGRTSYDNDTLVVLQVDAGGELVTAKGISNGELRHIRTRPAADGGLFIIGDLSVQAPAIEHYPIITKLTAAGAIAWQKTYFNPPYYSAAYNQNLHGNSWINDVAECANGDLLFCGRTAANPENNVGNFVMRTTATGDIIWVKGLSTTQTPQLEEPVLVKELANGDIRVVLQHPIIGTGSKVGLLTLDASGTVTMVKAYTSGYFGTQTPTDAYIAPSGETVITLSGSMVQFSATGDVDFAYSYLDQYTTAGLNALIKTADNGYAAAGYYGNHSLYSDPLLVKTRANGETFPFFTPLEVIELPYTNSSAPATLLDSVINAPLFDLNLEIATWAGADTLFGFSTGIHSFVQESMTVYPNPARDQVFLPLNSHHTALVELYTLTGTLVLRETFLPGAPGILDTKTLSSGMYLLKYSVNDASRYAKIMKE